MSKKILVSLSLLVSLLCSVSYAASYSPAPTEKAAASQLGNNAYLQLGAMKADVSAVK